MLKKKITPLSKFPTEALLKQYRENRICDTILSGIVRRYNFNTHQYEYWRKVKGQFWFPWNDEPTDNVVLSYERMINFDPSLYTTITSRQGGRRYICENGKSHWVNLKNFTKIHFDGMYWEGQLEEIKEELAKRPHVNMNSGKAYRKWLANYKKHKN